MSSIRLIHRKLKPDRISSRHTSESFLESLLIALVIEVAKAVGFDESKAIEHSALFRLYCSYNSFQQNVSDKYSSFTSYLKVFSKSKENYKRYLIDTFPVNYNSFIGGKIYKPDYLHIKNYLSITTGAGKTEF